MNRSRALLLAGLALAFAIPATAQVVNESVDLAVVQKIKEEGMSRSKLDELASYLTDVIGARLTNSPASRKANEWAAETFRSWGLANVKVESWDTAFGRGWEIVSYSGRILEPWPKPLAAYAQAWSGSTLVKGKPGGLTCQAGCWRFGIPPISRSTPASSKTLACCGERRAPSGRNSIPARPG